MKGRVFTIVPAAGSALRMGLGYSKAYLDVLNVPLLARTLKALLDSTLVDSIITAVRPTETDLCRREILEKYDLGDRVEVIGGGEHRQQTVAALLDRMIPGKDLILVHDGARPFVSPLLIKEVLEAAVMWGGAVPAVSATDTVKISEDLGQTVTSTLDRKKIFMAQTPQAFQKEVLIAAHKKAKKTGFMGTDDASLVEWAGYPVRIVPGDRGNIKVTTLDDLEMCRWIISSKDSSPN